MFSLMRNVVFYPCPLKRVQIIAGLFFLWKSYCGLIKA